MKLSWQYVRGTHMTTHDRINNIFPGISLECILFLNWLGLSIEVHIGIQLVWQDVKGLAYWIVCEYENCSVCKSSQKFCSFEQRNSWWLSAFIIEGIHICIESYTNIFDIGGAVLLEGPIDIRWYNWNEIFNKLNQIAWRTFSNVWWSKILKLNWNIV